MTFYARDDTAVASGHTVRYRFRLPAKTRLLGTTLAWTDPPGVQLVNNVNLSLTAPDGRVFVGNRWRDGGPPHSQFSDPLPTPAPATPFEAIHNVEQIVIPGAPTLPPGEYVVEVRGGPFRNHAFQTFPRSTLCFGLCGKWRRNSLWWRAWPPYPSLLESNRQPPQTRLSAALV